MKPTADKKVFSNFNCPDDVEIPAPALDLFD